MYEVQVSSFRDWLKQASILITARIPPSDICWHHSTTVERDLIACKPLPAVSASELLLPQALLEQLREASAYLDADRWSLPYRVLWRWLSGDRAAVLAGDHDGIKLARRIRAVSGAAHRMKGFLRFSERSADAGAPRFVAWYEPEHDVLETVAAHFVERMGQETWLIATPLGSAHYDGMQLSFGTHIDKPSQHGDNSESLWRDYYRSTFNPQRLNQALMQSHLPQRYRQNLPESREIPALIAAAQLGRGRQNQDGVAIRTATTHPGCSPVNAPRSSGLSSALEACRQCELWEHATYPVAGVGPNTAGIMLIGEQADDHDDLIGEAFSGPTGRFLDGLLREAGLAREEVYLSHAVKHFRFETRQLHRKYRSPAPHHVDACKGWLISELRSQRPRVVVALGRIAAIALDLETNARTYGAAPEPCKRDSYFVVQTWHPDFAMRGADVLLRTHAKAHITSSLKLAKKLVNQRYCDP